MKNQWCDCWKQKLGAKASRTLDCAEVEGDVMAVHTKLETVTGTDGGCYALCLDGELIDCDGEIIDVGSARDWVAARSAIGRAGLGRAGSKAMREHGTITLYPAEAVKEMTLLVQYLLSSEFASHCPFCGEALEEVNGEELE